MGAEGPGLFSDDIACDVRAEYQVALERGASDSEAEAFVLSQYAEELADPDDQVVVWLALAFTESRFGRLSDETRKRVLRVLNAGGDLDRWQQAGRGAVRQRRAVLARVRAQVTNPQPAPRKIRRSSRPTSSLTAGQILAYRARSGRMHLLRVSGLIDYGECVQPAIRFIDYADTDTPSPELLATLSDRQRHPKWKKVELRIVHDSSQAREEAGIFQVGTVRATGSLGTAEPKAASTWFETAKYIETLDQMLQGP